MTRPGSEGFPERLAACLHNAGISQATLARAAKTSHVNVLRWLRGEVEPKIGSVEKLAVVLKVGAGYLAYGMEGRQG